MATRHHRAKKPVHPRVKASAAGGAGISGLTGILAAFGSIDWKAFAGVVLTAALTAAFGYLKKTS